MTASAVPPRTLPIASWLAVGVTSPEAVIGAPAGSRQVETATPLAVAVARAVARECAAGAGATLSAVAAMAAIAAMH